MKNKIFNALMSLTLLAGFTACNEKWEPNGIDANEKGTLSTATLSLDIANIEQITDARSRAIDLTNYLITVSNGAGVNVEEWTYATMPGLPTFNVGDYTLTVESHIPEPAEWNHPHIKGSQDFTIEANKVTSIGTVKCSLQSLKVTVNYSDELSKASDGDLKCTVDVNTNGILTFEEGDNRAGYFVVPEGNTTMVATFSGTVNGYKEEITRTYTNIQNAKGKHLIINFSLKGGGNVVPPDEQGQWDPSEGITVDMEVTKADLTGNADPGAEEIIPGTRPGQEEWPEEPTPGGDDPVDPTPGDDVAATFTSETLDLNGINTCDISPASVTIDCPKGIAHLVVTIESTNPNFAAAIDDMFNGNSFDLAEPANDDLADTLSDPDGLNFPIRENVIGKTQIIFDITQFVPMIPALGAGDHSFTIAITDSEGANSKLVLKFKS